MIFLRLLDLSFCRTVDCGNGIDRLEGAGTDKKYQKYQARDLFHGRRRLTHSVLRLCM